MTCRGAEDRINNLANHLALKRVLWSPEASVTVTPCVARKKPICRRGTSTSQKWDSRNVTSLLPQTLQLHFLKPGLF